MPSPRSAQHLSWWPGKETGYRCWTQERAVRRRGWASLPGVGGFGHLGEMLHNLVKVKPAEAGVPKECGGVFGCGWSRRDGEGVGGLSLNARWLEPQEAPGLGWKGRAVPLPTFGGGGGRLRGPRLMAPPFLPTSDILNYYFLCNQAVSNPFQQVRGAGKGTGWRRAVWGLHCRSRVPGRRVAGGVHSPVLPLSSHRG